MRAFYSDHYVLPLPDGHKFSMAKYEILRRRVADSGLVSRGALLEAEAATGDELDRVHRREYVRSVREGTLGRALPEAIERAAADLAIYVSGADPHENDRFGRLKLTAPGLAARDRRVFAACRRAGLPVAVSMAGGYGRDVEATVAIHFETVRIAAEFRA